MLFERIFSQKLLVDYLWKISKKILDELLKRSMEDALNYFQKVSVQMKFIKNFLMVYIEKSWEGFMNKKGF